MWLYMEILMNTNHQFPDSILRIFEIQVDGRKALDILSLLMFTNVNVAEDYTLLDLIPGLDSGTNSPFSCIWKFL